MKITLMLALGWLVAAHCAFAAEVGAAPGSIHFTNAEVSQILPIYRTLTGLELVIDSRVRTVHHPITLQAKAGAKEEAGKLIEKALVGQARIVITRLDDKRASVTYNDALPVTPAKQAPRK